MRIASFLCGASLACALAVSAQAAGQTYPSFSSQQDARAGFGTNAKVALLWHWSEGEIHSVGVSKVVRGEKGVICVLPKPALQMKGIYPQVSVAEDESNTLAAFAYPRAEADLCPSLKYIEIDTFQAGGSSAKPSNSVGFFLVIE